MDTTSFSIPGDVVSLVGPNGVLAPYSFRWRNAYQLQVDFPPQGRAGDYALTIGPNILDVSGHAMDQDGDGSFGTVPGDRYNATWTITPPRIVQQTPNSYVAGTADHFTFSFDRPMDPTTFALADDIVEVYHDEVTRELGALQPVTMARVNDALKAALAIR